MINALPGAHYASSDSLLIILSSLLFMACYLIRFPFSNKQDLPRSPYRFNTMPCSTTPGMLRLIAHITNHNIAFWIRNLIGHSSYTLTELNHFSYCLRPSVSLSTLSIIRYRIMLKTRYAMRWVITFATALSAVSGKALAWRTPV